MILRAPVGTSQEVMVWLRGLQGAGCVPVADAAAQAEGEAGLGRPEGGGAFIDPRRVNVFLGETQDCKTQDARSESENAGEGLGL